MHVSASQRIDDGSGFLLKIAGGETSPAKKQLSGIAEETGLELRAPYDRCGEPVGRANHGHREYRARREFYFPALAATMERGLAA
jgi:hypothetical protein